MKSACALSEELNKMEFLEIESLRIRLQLNICAALEQHAVGLGYLIRLHHG